MYFIKAIRMRHQLKHELNHLQISPNRSSIIAKNAFIELKRPGYVIALEKLNFKLHLILNKWLPWRSKSNYSLESWYIHKFCDHNPCAEKLWRNDK